MSQRTHCIDCGLSFGLVDRSNYRSTCTECLGKMIGPFIECDLCGRAINGQEPAFASFLNRRYCESCSRDVYRDSGVQTCLITKRN